MSADRPACEVWQCERDGTVSGYYPRSFGRPGYMCPQHAYDPRHGFLPRPYSTRMHDRYFRSLV